MPPQESRTRLFHLLATLCVFGVGVGHFAIESYKALQDDTPLSRAAETVMAATPVHAPVIQRSLAQLHLQYSLLMGLFVLAFAALNLGLRRWCPSMPRLALLLDVMICAAATGMAAYTGTFPPLLLFSIATALFAGAMTGVGAQR